MAETVEQLAIRFRDEMSAGANAAAAASERLAKSIERAAAAAETEDQVIRRVGRSHDAVARQVDGAAAAASRAEAINRRHEASVAAVAQALDRQQISAQEAAAQTARLSILRDQEIAKAKAYGDAVEARFLPQQAAITKSTTAASMAMRNLGIQSIDVFQQLASGAPVMMTLVQQGGQVAQMAAVTGTSLGSLARSVGALALAHAPLIAALAGTAGVAFAMFTVGKRSVELESQQRSLGVAIAGVGRSAELSATGLQKYVTQLKQQGVAAEEAVKSVAALARNPDLSSGAIARIVGLAPDAAAAQGSTAAEAMKQMAEAAKGSVDAVQKLDDAFNLLTAGEAASVRGMIEHGDKAAALDVVFGKLSDRVKGLDQEALSPAGKAMRELGNAWSGFIDKVANSGVVLAAIEKVAAALRYMAGAVTGGGGGDDIAAIDARIAAATGTIPGVNATAARLRREQAQGLTALYAERNARAQALADAAEAGYGQYPESLGIGAFATPENQLAKEVLRGAATRNASSDIGKMQALQQEATKYRDLLGKLTTGSADYAEQSAILNAALKGTQKEIDDLNKKSEPRQAGLAKEAKVVQTATEKTNESIRVLTEATESQRRIAAAYDGTEGSITRAQAAEKAHTDALKANHIPGTEEYAKAVEGLNAAYLDSEEASRSFRQSQNSVQALFDVFGTALDRIGQGLVDMFLSGGKAAVTFGSIARAVFGSIATSIAQLAIVNPIINSVLGSSSRSTLGSALGAFGGGGGSSGGIGSLLSGGSDLFSLGKLTDAFGLTDIGGKLSGLGKYLGVTGEGGLVSGITDSISSLLATNIGGSSVEAATSLALAGLGPGVYGPATPATVAALQGGATIGGLASGIGLGFGAGSLVGGFTQSALGKVGPAPTIGAGAGAAAGALAGTFIFPGVGTVLGGLLGGVLGGAGGGLIGPGKPNAFSATGLTISGNGQLAVGQTESQLVDTTEQIAALTQGVNALNQTMAAFGARIANPSSTDRLGQNRLVGAGPLDNPERGGLLFGYGDGRPATLDEAFREFRFTSDNKYIAQGLKDQSFGSLAEFQTAVAGMKNFLDVTVPALKALGQTEVSYGVGSLETALQGLRQQFAEAIPIAEKMGWAEVNLTEAREKAIQVARDSAGAAINNIDRSFLIRRNMALGTTTDNPRLLIDATLMTFDAETDAQRKAFSAELLSIYGDAFKETEAYAARIKLLEEVRGAERVVSVKGYLDQINQAEKASQAQREAATGRAGGIVRSISDYVRGITFSPDSALSPSSRYNAARSQFETAITAARGGDADALSGLTGYAETFRTSSRAMFGSGANFVRDFDRIISALDSIATLPAETLTATVFSAETRTQTQTLVASLADLKAAIMQVRDEVRRTASAPPASRAA